MKDVRPRNRYTRRAALTLAAAAATTPAADEKPAHPVVFFEIGCRDRAKSAKFFGDLFGWGMQANGPATTIETASRQGIQGHINSLGHDPQNYTMFYVQVEDVKAYLDRAVELGGKVLVPPIKIPTGTFAWFSDIDGNLIGLLKPKA
ncbi:MAG: VOC family protein [Acidobacteria bacterium]|nr:VOC family protein [Acidobacteriota bacterium]